MAFHPLYLLIALFVSGAQAAPPAWATRDTQVLIGNRYRVVCSGEGPSIGLARQEAIDSCRVSAAQHLPTEITVRSMSVTSETDGAFQQEVLNRNRISGLVCVPKREQIEETESRVKVWTLCEFDLSLARTIPGGARPSAALLPVFPAESRRVLTLAVVPGCSSLIIRGGPPARIVRCDRNPVSLLVEPGDREVLVRSTGRTPKLIPVAKLQRAREYARVVLDPAG